MKCYKVRCENGGAEFYVMDETRGKAKSTYMKMIKYMGLKVTYIQLVAFRASEYDFDIWQPDLFDAHPASKMKPGHLYNLIEEHSCSWMTKVNFRSESFSA